MQYICLSIRKDAMLLCMPVAAEISKSFRVSSNIQKWTSMQPVYVHSCSFLGSISALNLYNIIQNNGYTALIFVCDKGHVKCAELLLSQHADINIRDKVNYRSIHCWYCYNSYCVQHFF